MMERWMDKAFSKALHAYTKGSRDALGNKATWRSQEDIQDPKKNIGQWPWRGTFRGVKLVSFPPDVPLWFPEKLVPTLHPCNHPTRVKTCLKFSGGVSISCWKKSTGFSWRNITGAWLTVEQTEQQYGPGGKHQTMHGFPKSSIRIQIKKADLKTSE